MIDELRLPPRRELPPEVRQRLRAGVAAGIARPVPRRGRVLGVAAAVVLLVAAAAVGTQIVRSESGRTPVADSTADPKVPTGPLDRCWAAAQKAGKTNRLPARDKWVKISSEEQGDDVVVAFTANGNPMFCETTSTTATLSDPDARSAYAPGSRTTVLLATGTGLVAGLADPSWSELMLSLPDGLGVSTAKVTASTHQFTSFTLTDPATHQFWAQRVEAQGAVGTRSPLAPAPKPLFTVVDRPGDRSSPAGKALGACLAGVAQPPADRDGYQPGVLLNEGSYQVVLGRTAGHAVACTAEPDPNNPAKTSYKLYLDTFIGQSIPVRRLSVPGLGNNGTMVPFVGIVPPASTSMVADFSLGKAVDVAVANGTFGMWLPAGAKPLFDGLTWVKAVNADGAPLFNGYVPMK